MLLVPPDVVTVTRYTVPFFTAGVTAVIVLEDTTVICVAGSELPPDCGAKLTVAPVTNPVPVIVTAVPLKPEVGLMLETIGTYAT